VGQSNVAGLFSSFSGAVKKFSGKDGLAPLEKNGPYAYGRKCE